jgi:bifunctional DNase/RNase
VTSAVELEVRHVHLVSDDPAQADAYICARGDAPSRALRLRLSYGDAHQLAHELQGQETPRSHAVAVMRDLAHSLGGRLEAVCLGPNANNQIIAVLRVSRADGPVEFPVSPGQALAIAVRLGVKLLGDERLLSLTSQPVPPDPVARFLETLDLSGLGD